jgi:hypothetical protein
MAKLLTLIYVYLKYVGNKFEKNEKGVACSAYG